VHQTCCISPKITFCFKSILQTHRPQHIRGTIRPQLTTLTLLSRSRRKNTTANSSNPPPGQAFFNEHEALKALPVHPRSRFKPSTPAAQPRRLLGMNLLGLSSGHNIQLPTTDHFSATVNDLAPSSHFRRLLPILLDAPKSQRLIKKPPRNKATAQNPFRRCHASCTSKSVASTLPAIAKSAIPIKSAPMLHILPIRSIKNTYGGPDGPQPSTNYSSHPLRSQ